MDRAARKAFTLIELVVVVGILLVIGAIAVVNIAGRRTSSDLSSVTQEVATTLRQAQSDSIADEGGLPWGVPFSNSATSGPIYVLFTGGSYATGTQMGYYHFPATVAYVTSTLASGAVLDIIFTPVTGASSVSTSIGLYMPGQKTNTSSLVSVNSVGAVSY